MRHRMNDIFHSIHACFFTMHNDTFAIRHFTQPCFATGTARDPHLEVITKILIWLGIINIK